MAAAKGAAAAGAAPAASGGAAGSHGLARLYWQQTAALTRKNLLIRGRAWKASALLVAQAALFVCMIWAVDQAVLSSNQRRPAFSVVEVAAPQQVAPIPDCRDNIFLRADQPCYAVLYTPQGVPVVERVMAAVAANNAPPLPPNQLRGFANASEANAWMMAHPGTALAAVHFEVETANSVAFTLQTNSSLDWFKGSFQDSNTYVQLPVQVAVERELSRLLLNAPRLEWDVSVAQFPHPAASSPSMIANFAPTFLFASIMFQFVLLLHDVVHEKESGVRRAMRTMGLKDTPFWASWVVLQGGLAIVEACLLVIFSYAFGFELFTKNAFGLSFLLILMVSLAMTSFGFCAAAFMRKTSAAVPAGFFLFVVAWVILIVIAFGFPYSPKYSPAAVYAFSILPWSLLGKGIQDLAAASQGRGGGLTWADRYDYCQAVAPSPARQAQLSYWQADCVMPLGDIYGVLAWQCVFWFVLALYLDNVVADEMGVKRSGFYFLQPSYWAPSTKPDTQKAVRALMTGAAPSALEDPDVQQERERMRTRCEAYIAGEGAEAQEQPYAVEMFGLRKVYTSGILRRKQFVAIHGNWLGILKGECFCLLGPNGAGKSTTINCLTGILPFSAGDALVHGHSISTANGMNRARPITGVCPQFDILWDNLTGIEHLLLFANIKGLPVADMEEEALKLLEEVKLTEAATIRTGAYSGGMRRRLSVAIALLGNPQVVYLDEPTTGLDPISRRHLWDLIDKAKKARAVVLTTHSMEEADILGDRIGIMARGRLRCVGTSLRLKSRFGSGYRISVRVGQGDSSSANDAAVLNRLLDGIKEVFQERLGVASVDQSMDYVHFLVPYENEDKLPMLFAYLKAHGAELCIADLQLRQTPLEEVFLNVSRRAELEHAQAVGHYEMLTIPEENVSVKVPTGAEFIKSPAGYLYHIKWTQDEKGGLRMQDFWRDPASAAAAMSTTKQCT